jgi:hypothetical protein
MPLMSTLQDQATAYVKATLAQIDQGSTDMTHDELQKNLSKFIERHRAASELDGLHGEIVKMNKVLAYYKQRLESAGRNL